ncbi:MAG: hypothetical protein R2795_00635 [Saprospiraceae bacterium]
MASAHGTQARSPQGGSAGGGSRRGAGMGASRQGADSPVALQVASPPHDGYDARGRASKMKE